MRDEIAQLIQKSGTVDENTIIEIYTNALRKRGRPQEEIDKITANKTTIQIMKNGVGLANKNIKDDEIEEIATMIVNKKPNTRQISLNNNCISNQGAIKLAALFESLENLVVLDLQSNNIGEEGMYALFRLNASKPKLKLALGGNKITHADELEELKRKVEKNTP